MNSKEYDFWINKINQDAIEVAEELHEAFPQIPKDDFVSSQIKRSTQALDYLIAHDKEVCAYSLATTSSDIINGRIKI